MRRSRSAATPAREAVRSTLRKLRRRAQVRGAAWRSRLPIGDGDVDRLVNSPVFVLSAIRSGSTLLRMVLDAHSQICAPHELHLHGLTVSMPKGTTEQALDKIGLDADRLELMLWDRVLLREMARAQKPIVVDKTPKNTYQWARIAKFWPDARYIILLRHPVHVVESMHRARPDIPVEDHYALMDTYARLLAEARDVLGGITVRYEDFTSDPETWARSICGYLGVPFEPGMLAYLGAPGERTIVRGLGDWSKTLRSGEIRPAAPLPLPDEIPAELVDACRRLGYL